MPSTVALNEAPTDVDLDRIAAQLGRAPRQVQAIRARCVGDWPAVVETLPRLEDCTPFPTLYYLTCRALNASISTLESEGLMRDYAELLTDDEIAQRYRRAHEAYLSDRESLLEVAEIANVSAGGMPDRVKCLHSLVAHSLAVGPGVNPIGDLAVGELVARGLWPHPSPCVPVESSAAGTR